MEFGLGESVLLQLTGKLNRSFCLIFLENFFTSPSLLRKLTDNSLYRIGVVQQNRQLLTKIEKPKTNKEEISSRKGTEEAAKAKRTCSWFMVTSQKSFNRGDSDYLVSKDGLVTLRWKDSKVVMLLTNCMDPSKLTSVE